MIRSLMLMTTGVLVEEAFACHSHMKEETEARNCSSGVTATFPPLAISWQ